MNKIYNESTIMFKIEVYSSISNKDWTVMRTYNHFKQLNITLNKGFLNTPNFPDKISIYSNNDVNQLRIVLQKYLQILIENAEFINSSHLRQFLELENHITDFSTFQPLLINEINDNSMEVTSIAYSASQSLLFAGYAYSSATGGLSSYFSSLSSLINNSNLGMIAIFHMVKSSYGEIHTEKVFEQKLTSQVSKISYLEGENLDLLTVGLYDGHLLIFKIYTNLTSYVSKNLVDLIAKIRPHKNRIIDIGVDPTVGYIYSAAINEKHIAISEINYESVIKTFQVSGYSLTTFYYEKESKRIFVTDSASSIWILQIEENINIKTIQALHHPSNSLPNVNCLRVEPDRNFLFLGTSQGVIKFYDYEEEGSRVKIFDRLTIYAGVVKINDIRYRSDKSGLITALSNGSIAFWSHNENAPEFILDCHEKSVNQIIYDGSVNLIFTCSSDKSIKIWHLPQHWPSELMRQGTEGESDNERSFIEDYTVNRNSMLNLKNALLNIDIERGNSFKMSTEDDIEVVEVKNEEVEVEVDVKKEDNKSDNRDELINKEYMYDDSLEQDETLLDGWEKETPLGYIENREKIDRMNLLFISY